MERDEIEKRKVDPYHLVYRGGQFYLIGHSHERDAVRVFRLSRIRGKVSYATKAEHDFSAPEDFDRRDYASRAEWQIGRDRGHARRSSCASGSPGWSSATSAPTARSARPRKGDGAPGKGEVFETDYAPAASSSPGCCAGARTRPCWSRRSSPTRSPSASTCCASATRGELRDRAHGRRGPPPPAPRGRRSQRPLGVRDPPGALRPPGHARRDADRGGQARASGSPVAEVSDEAQPHRRGAARGHRAAQRRQLRRRHLRPLRRDRRATRSRSTPSPTATASRAPRACCRSRRRRWSPRSTSSATTCPRPGSPSARDKIVDALGHDPSEEGLEIAASGGDDSERRARSSTRRSPTAACSRSTTTRRTRTSSPSARSSPTASPTAPRAGTSPPRTASATTSATSASTASRRPR